MIERIKARPSALIFLAWSYMTDDDVITLSEAAERFGFGISTLRAEAERGRLTTYKIGKRVWTKPADIREMVERCRVEPRVRDFTLTRDESSSSSETERVSCALAAANETVIKLKNSSRDTSRTSISPNRRGRH
jgi:hypothetical protein